MAAPGELWHELHRAHADRWTHADELAALQLEQTVRLAGLVRYLLACWTDKEPKLKPYRYPRPGQRHRPRPATLDEIRRFFGGGRTGRR